MATIQAGAFHRRNFTTVASEQLTIDSTAGGVPLTAATYGSARYATITVKQAEINFTADATPPTSSVGNQAAPPDVIELESNEEIVAFRAIRTGSVSGIIYVNYKELKLTS
jgi:hypothetical protein